MSIIYRAEKGAPLSAEEVDGNFKELEMRLQQLEEHPEAPESLGRIDVQGDQISLIGTFGTDFGTFTLPKATLHFNGKWLPQILYQKLQMVTYDKALYCCLQEHTSTQWERDTSQWQEILSLPAPPSAPFPLYERSTLPAQETLGKLGILMGEEDPNLIFFNGKNWQLLMIGETI
ncbi:MAG TPA: hypothetical protein VMW10_00470 [Alphaproteobacteria bacterium]|nr:hypothetical protein [Alphaproteobacteria bacterium]